MKKFTAFTLCNLEGHDTYFEMYKNYYNIAEHEVSKI